MSQETPVHTGEPLVCLDLTGAAVGAQPFMLILDQQLSYGRLAVTNHQLGSDTRQ
jgi:hypothetical protein